MNDQADTFLYRLRLLFVGMLVVAALFVLTTFVSTLRTAQARAQSEPSANSSVIVSDDPNVVTTGLADAADNLGYTMGLTVQAIGQDVQSAGAATMRGSKQVAKHTQTGAATVARGVGSGAAFVGNATWSGVTAVFGAPGKAIKYVSNLSVVSSVIRPAEHMEVPIIDPNSPELQAAIAALPPTQPAPAAPQTAGPQWPIHGAVTTNFGVSHWPYQRTHTGLDISDGQRAGVTPIKPFRPGKVIETVYSRVSLGNHVVIDHGNGVTSVYGHLASIAVQTGQDVTLDTTLGYEGSTGVSTGTHLHFEIRVNSQAADPRQFINGQP